MFFPEVVSKCKHFRSPENFSEFKTEMIEVLRAANQRHRNHRRKQLHLGKNKKKWNQPPVPRENVFKTKEGEANEGEDIEVDEAKMQIHEDK